MGDSIVLLSFIPLITILISCCGHSFLIYRKYERQHFDGIKYTCFAKTKEPLLDHRYSFNIKYVAGQYRCYVIKRPEYRGRDTSNYMPHCWIDNNNRKYICWTGKIEHIKQAKTLCRKWSDATQQFIDTGIPAPGFERQA